MEGQRAGGLVVVHILRRAELVLDGLVALAGYSKDDIELELKDSTLTVRNKQKEKVVNDDSNGVIHKGISTRQFERAFTISEDIKVKNAELQNGLLNIDLERIIPDEKKARLINIS